MIWENGRIIQATDKELGRLYSSFDSNVEDLIDSLIRGKQAKITVIRYFVNEFSLSLMLAKILYEARESWLSTGPNPFGW